MISNSPLLVMLPAPSTSILPALQVTLPSLTSAAPVSQILAPPLMFKAPPLAIDSGPAKLPPLQVPTALLSITSAPGPLPPNTPALNVKPPVVNALLVKLAVPPLTVTLARRKALLAP